ncbi:MAG: hypothetical protein JWR12_885 [Mucilaginibacter sp.]|jgi:hypothetical protein|nr:hypothetical protein [Mucilaginibacter sp.]
MKKEKLSLGSIKNVLSRAELKKIMAGSGGLPCQNANNYCQHVTYPTFLCCDGLYCLPTGDPTVYTCQP